jgi:hypothetical protein
MRLRFQDLCFVTAGMLCLSLPALQATLLPRFAYVPNFNDNIVSTYNGRPAARRTAGRSSAPSLYREPSSSSHEKRNSSNLSTSA